MINCLHYQFIDILLINIMLKMHEMTSKTYSDAVESIFLEDCVPMEGSSIHASTSSIKHLHDRTQRNLDSKKVKLGIK